MHQIIIIIIPSIYEISWLFFCVTRQLNSSSSLCNVRNTVFYGNRTMKIYNIYEYIANEILSTKYVICTAVLHVHIDMDYTLSLNNR